jgi:hypothetical protein
MPEAVDASGPDAAMMAGPETLARFLKTADERVVRDAFSAGDLVILENFPPHVFTGQGGLDQWRGLMARHVAAISNLRHTFGPPQDFVRTGDTAYFSLPTRWTGGPRRQAVRRAWRLVVRAGARRRGLADSILWLVGGELRPVARDLRALVSPTTLYARGSIPC